MKTRFIVIIGISIAAVALIASSAYLNAVLNFDFDNVLPNKTPKEDLIRNYQYEITGETGGAGSHTKSELFITRSDDHSVELSKDLYYTDIILFFDWKIHTFDNYVFVIWITSEQSWSDVFLAVSDDYGKTFDIKNISQSKEYVHQYKIDFSKETIYLVWDHEFVTEDNYHFNQIYFTKSDNFGDSFGQQKLLSTFDKPAYEFELEAFGDNVFVAWRQEPQSPDEGNIWFATSTDRAEWFDREDKIQGGHLSADSYNDVLHLTWVPVEDDTQIWYASSDDLGQTLNSRKVFDADWKLSPYADRPIPKITAGDEIIVEFTMNNKDGEKTDYKFVIDESAKCGPGTYLIDGICVKNEDTRGPMEPEPECKPEPRPENEEGLWIFDYEKCEWNKKQWWMSDQLEKIIQDCLDPENQIGDKGMSNGTTKLKTTTCTWQHGGFYNQVYVEEWADPVPLIQDNKVIGPDGQIFKILEN